MKVVGFGTPVPLAIVRWLQAQFPNEVFETETTKTTTPLDLARRLLEIDGHVVYLPTVLVWLKSGRDLGLRFIIPTETGGVMEIQSINDTGVVTTMTFLP